MEDAQPPDDGGLLRIRPCRPEGHLHRRDGALPERRRRRHVGPRVPGPRARQGPDRQRRPRAVGVSPRRRRDEDERRAGRGHREERGGGADGGACGRPGGLEGPVRGARRQSRPFERYGQDLVAHRRHARVHGHLRRPEVAARGQDGLRNRARARGCPREGRVEVAPGAAGRTVHKRVGRLAAGRRQARHLRHELRALAGGETRGRHLRVA